MKSKLPKFEGKSLIKIPEFIPQVDFFKGDFGKAFLEEYKGIVKSDYNNNSFLNIFNYRDGIIKGSNSYAVVLANQILIPEKLRTATQADLEKILNIKSLDLRKVYVDTGLVLRSGDEPNKYLAKDLENQVKRMGYKSTKDPLVIWLNQLKLENDKNSPHGLRFKLSDNCKPFYAPILKNAGNFLSDNIDEKIGFPKKIGNGDRYLSSRSSGLSRLYLNRGSYLNSFNNNLLDSDEGGHVVVVSDGNTHANFK